MSTDTMPAPPRAIADAADVVGAPAATAERLHYAFDVRPVLRNVTFAVPEGACCALLGPNGAGKTTLLRVLATLVKPTGGAVHIAGLDVRRESAQIRRLVGYVGHQPLVYDELTARENLLFFARLYGVGDREARVAALLDRVGLRARAGERGRMLSRGQLQRLALARGILHQPRLLLLDEPDTGLDREALGLLEAIIAERKAAGLTTIVTTHDLDRGLALSTRVLLLIGGRIVRDTPSAALLATEVSALCSGASRPRTAEARQ